MAWRRTRIDRVRIAAWAGATSAGLALPLAIALLTDQESPVPVPVAGTIFSSTGGGGRQEGVRLEPPSTRLQQVTVLRDAGDVAGLLAFVIRAHAEPDARSLRASAVALASLAAIPGDEAHAALVEVVRSERASSLERTTALASLWERGDRAFVSEQGRDSDDPAIRSKARALLASRG